jgi:hypothetical protein
MPMTAKQILAELKPLGSDSYTRMLMRNHAKMTNADSVRWVTTAEGVLNVLGAIVVVLGHPFASFLDWPRQTGLGRTRRARLDGRPRELPVFVYEIINTAK